MGIVSGTLGRSKGFPKTKDRIESGRIITTQTDRWEFTTDDPDLDGTDLIDLLPTSFQLGTFNGRVRIKDRNLERSRGNRLRWYLDLTLDDQFSDEDDEDKDKPPDQRKPEWSWDFETVERVMTQDHDDPPKPVRNSAEDPIELTETIPVPVLTIERLQASFDPDIILNYGNRTNKSDFWGAAPTLALMAGIRDRKDAEVFNGISYRRVTYTIKFMLPSIANVSEGWRAILLDHGPNYLDSGEKKAVLDPDGHKITANLSAAGAILNPGTTPHLLRFETHQEAEFNDLGINLGQF